MGMGSESKFIIVPLYYVKRRMSFAIPVIVESWFKYVYQSTLEPIHLFSKKDSNYRAEVKNQITI